MTEMRQPREVDMVPEELRFVPQVKSDIIIQRRDVTLAPIEAANQYTRDGTNTITFNIQGHRELSQLLDTKSMYFTWHCALTNAYPVEDVSMLIEEIIISSNGRTIERIRHAQYIQHFLRGYGMSRKSKARLGKRSGFQRFEDRTVQLYRNTDTRSYGLDGEDKEAPASADVAALVNYFGFGFRKGAMTSTAAAMAANAEKANDLINGELGYTDQVGGLTKQTWGNMTRMSENLGYEQKQVQRLKEAGETVVFDEPGITEGTGTHHLMKFRLPCSGLLSSEKMLPIGWMPLTIQLRLQGTHDKVKEAVARIIARLDGGERR